jgi:hypothetical protein
MLDRIDGKMPAAAKPLSVASFAEKSNVLPEFERQPGQITQDLCEIGHTGKVRTFSALCLPNSGVGSL